jgi:hypothetical protein
VVAENAVNAVARADPGQHRRERRQDMRERAVDTKPVIARQHHQIDLQPIDEIGQAPCRVDVRIEVEIGQLQHGVAVERRRQIGEPQLEPVEPDVDRVAHAPPIEPDELEEASEEADEVREQPEPSKMALAVGHALLAVAFHVAATDLPALARRRVGADTGRGR